VAVLFQTQEVFALRLEGPPIAQPRHRIGPGRGKFPRAYIPGDHPVHAYKSSLRILAQLTWKCGPMQGALESKVLFVCDGIEKPGEWKATRFDLDNGLKAVWDALSGVIFADDCQIAAVHAYKRFRYEHERSRVEIEIRPLQDISPPGSLQ